MPQHAVSMLTCHVLSSARSCHSSICPGRLSTVWLVSLVVFSCHYGLQVVTREVHLSSLRRLIVIARIILHVLSVVLLHRNTLYINASSNISVRLFHGLTGDRPNTTDVLSPGHMVLWLPPHLMQAQPCSFLYIFQPLSCWPSPSYFPLHFTKHIQILVEV